MKLRIFAAGCFLLGAASLLLANGGGYFRGGLENAGDVAGFEPVATGNIRILDEKLNITLGPKEADVEVRYLMRNETDKKVKVRFGFPVEESFDQELMGAPADGPAPDGKKLAYCRNYQLSAAGKAVKAVWQGEIRETKDPHFKGVAGWLISEVTFAPHEEKPVMIRFQSSYPLEEWSVSDDESTTAGIFRYRLSTAACWAGTIGTGRIVIEAKGIDPAEIRILKPVGRFKKEGVRWIWDFENLEPALADDLEIEAFPAERRFGRAMVDKSGEVVLDGKRATYVERGKQWSILHSNYGVKASSTLKPKGEISYAPENVRKIWFEIAWSEGAPGPGIGEWLELTPVEAKPLIGVHVWPGYQKGELFAANPRPKKIQVLLNEEHRFDAEIPDKAEEVRIPVRDYVKPVRKLRITVLEVYPGTRHEDLCISAISLNVKLDRKPAIQPAR